MESRGGEDEAVVDREDVGEGVPEEVEGAVDLFWVLGWWWGERTTGVSAYRVDREAYMPHTTYIYILNNRPSHLQPLRPRKLEVPVLRKEGIDTRALRAAEGRGDEFAAPERPRYCLGLDELGEGLEQDALVQVGVVRQELGDGHCMWYDVCWMVADTEQRKGVRYVVIFFLPGRVMPAQTPRARAACVRSNASV